MGKILPDRLGCKVWGRCFNKSVLPPTVSRWYDSQDRVKVLGGMVAASMAFPDCCHIVVSNGRNMRPLETFRTQVTEPISTK